MEPMQELLQELRDRLDLALERNRLATFKKWVFSKNKKCNASAMAEAGFVYVGTKQDPDSVRCFLCKKSLDSWEADDDPWAEHRKHAPHCTFAKYGRPEAALTLKEYVGITNELNLKFFEDKGQEERKRLEDRWDEAMALVSGA